MYIAIIIMANMHVQSMRLKQIASTVYVKIWNKINVIMRALTNFKRSYLGMEFSCICPILAYMVIIYTYAMYIPCIWLLDFNKNVHVLLLEPDRNKSHHNHNSVHEATSNVQTVQWPCYMVLLYNSYDINILSCC